MQPVKIPHIKYKKHAQLAVQQVPMGQGKNNLNTLNFKKLTHIQNIHKKIPQLAQKSDDTHFMGIWKLQEIW